MAQARRRLITWGSPFAFLGTIILGLLIFLSSLALQDSARPRVRISAPPSPEASGDLDTRIERVNKAVDEVSATLPLALPPPVREPQGASALRWIHRRYDLTLPKPDDFDAFDTLFDPLRNATPGVVLQVTEQSNGAQVQVGVDGLRTHTLTFHWLGRKPRVAIVIDNLGNDLVIARELADLDVALTFAIRPFRPFSSLVAERVTLAGREVLLHLPMEAETAEEVVVQGVLQTAAKREEVERFVDSSLEALPQAVGVNNHLGSRFTANRERMQWLLERLQPRKLFFLDSLTTPHSVACAVAKSIPVACATRDLFLDDVDDETLIGEQLDTLLKLARLRGDMIAIGHSRTATLKALREALPSFAQAGVEIVSVSALLADSTLSRP